MNAVRTILRELAGLFVEDAGFALAIALWLLAIGAASVIAIGSAQARAYALFAGLALILVASVARGARRR